MKKIWYAIFVLALAALLVSMIPQSASPSTIRAAQTVVYDVACDGSTFVLNRQNTASSAIKRGDTFVLNGKIYPGNTIPTGGTRTAPSSFGPESAGSIGTWFCKGTFLVGAAKFDAEKIQRVTTHYFTLNDKNRLITEGFEGSVNITRIVLGGIGQYAASRGLVTMERLGVNATESYNLRFTFNLE